MKKTRFFAMDCFYRIHQTTCCCVHFSEPRASMPTRVDVRTFEQEAEDYKPGEFFRRELPFLIRLINCYWNENSIAIIDGYVWLGEQKPGLGARLFEELGSIGAIVGIAKSEFRGSLARQVFRGKSKKPLFVSSVGMQVDDAARFVQEMSGDHRLPTMVKIADTISRRGEH